MTRSWTTWPRPSTLRKILGTLGKIPKLPEI